MSLQRRSYKSYEQYVKHQQHKLPSFLAWMKNRFEERYKHFVIRLQPLVDIVKDKRVLCLGARTGEEVRAFRQLGFTEAIGIDLNPGLDNKYVVKGDFQNLTYSDNSFDGIYSNALDHAWDLKEVTDEAHRVLKPNGVFVIDMSLFVGINRKKHLQNPSTYESTMWDSVDDIIQECSRFKLIDQFPVPDFLNHVYLILKPKNHKGEHDDG